MYCLPSEHKAGGLVTASPKAKVIFQDPISKITTGEICDLLLHYFITFVSTYSVTDLIPLGILNFDPMKYFIRLTV